MQRSILFILIGGGLMIVTLVLFLALGVTVIQTYNNESEYKKTKCHVRGIDVQPMNSKDDWYKCPWTCTVNHTPDGLKTQCEISEFPCLRIVVDVETKHGLKSAILHENPDKMRKYTDCSTFYCDRDSVVNEKEVNKFRKKYGNIGSQYSCYYNVDSLLSDDYDDDGQEHALLKLSYNQASYVNSIFWPALAGLVGLVMGLYGLFTLYAEKKRASDERKKNARLLNGY